MFLFMFIYYAFVHSTMFNFHTQYSAVFVAYKVNYIKKVIQYQIGPYHIQCINYTLKLSKVMVIVMMI